MYPPTTPRSTLHALSPLGLGTPDVEGMSSYFCRLAHSHSVSAQKLADWVQAHFGRPVRGRYDWHQRNATSMSATAEQWAAWVSELTGVGGLDRLTLAPWRHVFGTPGLAPKSDRWCPGCLSEDRKNGGTPYLRLSWDVAPVTACLRHKTALISRCPHCERSNVRNRAAIVVPGYCTACGGFLGDAPTESATPEALWIARRVGQALAQAPLLNPDDVAPLLQAVIERMGGGNMAAFARRFHFTKSGVSHWIRGHGLPSLSAWLTLSLHGGIGLDKLFAGDIEHWDPPQTSIQMDLGLGRSPRAGIPSKKLDWDEIRRDLRAMLELPVPISINDAAARVGVGRKHLYLNANTEARAIAHRHSEYRTSTRTAREAAFQGKVGVLLAERLAAGYGGISARDVREQLAGEANGVSNVFGHINQAARRGPT